MSLHSDALSIVGVIIISGVVIQNTFLKEKKIVSARSTSSPIDTH